MTHDPQLLDLLVRYEELRAQGLAITPEDLCRDCPERLADVQRELEQLHAVSHFLHSTPPDEGLSTDSTGPDLAATARILSRARYRPVRFHARGGLGEVFLAQDAELDREVALKRIQVGRDSDDSRRRFLREAAITARAGSSMVPSRGTRGPSPRWRTS